MYYEIITSVRMAVHYVTAALRKLPCDGLGFNSRSERCIYRASRPSQRTVNGGAVSK